jgi:hypothetical protein
MNHAYQRLSEDAVELLERDEAQREALLDEYNRLRTLWNRGGLQALSP